MPEGKITIKLSRNGMIAIRTYGEIIINSILKKIAADKTIQNKDLYAYAKAHAAVFEIRSVCEKMNKSTYIRGFDTKEYKMSISFMQGYCLLNYQTYYNEKFQGDYENMVVRTTIENILKELIK